MELEPCQVTRPRPNRSSVHKRAHAATLTLAQTSSTLSRRDIDPFNVSRWTKYDKSRFLGLAWVQRLRRQLPTWTQQLSEQFGVELEYEFLAMGSFNSCYRLKGLHSIIRLPILGKSAFRYEKSRDECLLMAYLARHTSIPLPKLLTAETCEMGPYMVLSFVDGSRLSDYLKDKTVEDAPITLQPNIDIALLSRSYRSMATLILQLSKCRFKHVVAIGQDELGNWLVTKRPVTLNMNQLVSCANYPPPLLPPKERAFSSANEYFTALAEMHITHLRTQRNDAIDDAEDCRKKYVARHLFLKIARTFSKEHNDGPFPLYCDDLRPTNVIVNPELDVRGVIDWEYCYAATAEFTYCPPWWLLLTHPDDWTDGDLGLFLEQYLTRSRLFLDALRDEETEMIQRGTLSETERLATRMAESLENGHFWFCLAATSSFGFDDIFWKFIDPLYFGDFTTLEDRVHLLAQPEQDELAYNTTAISSLFGMDHMRTSQPQGAHLAAGVRKNFSLGRDTASATSRALYTEVCSPSLFHARPYYKTCYDESDPAVAALYKVALTSSESL